MNVTGCEGCRVTTELLQQSMAHTATAMEEIAKRDKLIDEYVQIVKNLLRVTRWAKGGR